MQALDILGKLDEFLEMRDHRKRILDFLSQCQLETGGFSGGNMQNGHVSDCYAAVMALVTIGTKEAYSLINRKGMHRFLLSLKDETIKGAIRMEPHGEIDMRSMYCAISVAKILNILDDDLKKDVVGFITKCQTHEGGFGGVIHEEAHGGYTYCAYAALCLLDAQKSINI